MPIYEYECPACGNREEQLCRSFDDGDKEKKCSKCNSVMKKLVSSSTFTLKGGGWFQDGYSNATKVKNKNKSEEKG